MERHFPPTTQSDQDSAKKIKNKGESAATDLGEDLILEILKRADPRTLARAASVSRRWRELVEEERVWEAVCTRHWASLWCGAQQMRSVVLALGGFRRLHSVYLLPLLQPSCRPRSGLASLPPHSAVARGGHVPKRWGKDEVQLSMALLSIGYFERMLKDFNTGGER